MERRAIFGNSALAIIAAGGAAVIGALTTSDKLPFHAALLYGGFATILFGTIGLVWLWFTADEGNAMEDNKKGEVVGLDLTTDNGMVIDSTGSAAGASTGAVVEVSGAPGQSVYGVRVRPGQNPGGTGLRIKQTGPGIGLHIKSGPSSDDS